MSLFGSIQMAGNALQANDIAMQVIGQNIANANTPGYIREEVVLVPAATQRQGGLLLGLGVQVRAVVQKLDEFLEQRLRGATSDQASAETSESTYAQLEGILAELSETDISTLMNNFFGSVAEILNQPEDRSVRNLATLEGETLTESISDLSSRTVALQQDLNQQVEEMGGELNRLVQEVRTLNIQIAEAEGGNVSPSDAVGLRDQRLNALQAMAEMIDIRVTEQPSGGVTVYCGGDFLVFDGVAREVEAVVDAETGMFEIHLAETQAPLRTTSGELHGLMESRDHVLGGFLNQLDDYASTLIFEFNKLYSGGQGLTGFDKLTADFKVDNIAAPLNSAEANLAFKPVNGSFQVLIYNTKTKLTQTTDIKVNLSGLGTQTTMAELAANLNAVDGLKATLESDGTFTLEAESPDQQFAFANDTSHALAALGINTFFSGTSASTIGVNLMVQGNPSLFAASRGGIGVDTDLAVDLAAFLDRPLDTRNGDSIGVIYSRMTANVTQGSTIAKSEADGARVFALSLEGQKLATSGVNLDEEAINMITFQRAYQASARYISVLSELFDILVRL